MRKAQLILSLIVACLLLAPGSQANESADIAGSEYSGSDSTNPVTLPGIVVASDRLPVTLWEIPSAVTITDRAGRERITAGSSDDFLASLPGLRAYPAGNEWGQPIVDVRGFTGGGQSQYLLVMLDGIPLNNMSSGLVNWSMVNMADVGRAELLRGPVSAQYGDFGIGGLVSFYTPAAPAQPTGRLSLLGGRNNAYGYDGEYAGTIGGNHIRLSGSLRRSLGWRHHSDLRSHSAMATFDRTWAGDGKLGGLIAYGHSDEEIPGALTADALRADRTANATDFMGRPIEDRRDADYFVAGAHVDLPLGTHTRLKTMAYSNGSWADDITTTTQAMSHEPRTVSVGGESSLNIGTKIASRDFRAQIGIAAESGELRTSYASAEPGDDQILSEGSGTRTTVSGFVKAALYPTRSLMITSGVRLDYVGTRFTWDSGAAVIPGEVQRHSDSRLSPSLGASLRISSDITAFATVSGAFKAPTLIHLYDSQPFFNPYPPTPGYLLISNRDLKPMRGTHVEIGARFKNAWQFEGSLNAYNYWVDNEIDFDLATLSYQNIGKSRHTGVELILSRPVAGQLRAEGSLAYDESVIRAGEFKGNQINSIPLWSYRLGAVYDVPDMGTIGAEVHGISKQYLDIPHEFRLKDYATVDVHATAYVSTLTLVARLDNVFDREYEYDGYADPLLQGAPRYYPAPGRQFSVSLTGGF
jgi:outer membrane receptor protein involved in Fe transport